MIAPKKSNFTDPKRLVEWFYEPEDGEADAWLKQACTAWRALPGSSPPADAVVLVTDGKGYALGRVDAAGTLVVEGETLTATHWLPLPSLPEPATGSNGGGSIFRHNNSWRRY
ncbi:MAG: hypothetical protein HQL96_14990 [Magnetococcales bacterium]|nr:hypothetical protein [Magnetococcales bacterium]